MERITIAELDIDTEALVKEAAETSGQIQKLKDAQKELRNENKQGTEEYVKQAAEIKRLNTIQRSQERSIIALTDETGKLNSVEERLIDLTEQNIKSNRDATENTRELIRIRDLLNTETKEGAEAVEQINQKIDQNNAFLDKNSDEVTKNRRNVGNYKDSVKEALSEVSNFSGVLGENVGFLGMFTPIFSNLKDDFKETINSFREGATASDTYTASQKAAAAANNVTTNSLRLLKLALISTGIGAFVVLLGSLVTFLTKTQKGMDAVSTGGAVLGSVINSLLKPVLSLGEFLFDAFNDPQQAVSDLWESIKTNILDRVSGITGVFSGLREVIKGAFTLDVDQIKEGTALIQSSYTDTINGIKEIASDAKEAVSDLLNETVEGARAAREIAQLRRENAQFETSIKAVNAELQQQAELLAGTADNATKSFAEREQASRDLAQVEQERVKNEIEAFKQRELIATRELQLAQDQGQATRELEATRQEATASRIQAEAELTSFTRENEQRLSELKQDRLERDLDFELDLTETRKKIALEFVATEANAFEEREAKLQQTNDLINESFVRQGEIIQQFTDQRLDLNAILAEDDAAKTLEQVRNLGLSEIVEGRLLEIIRDRQDALNEVNQAQANLGEQRTAQLEEQLQAEKDVLAAARETRKLEFDAYLEDLRNRGEEETTIKLEQAQFEFDERTRQIEEQNALRLEQLRSQKESEQITEEEFRQQEAEAEITKNQTLLRAESTFARKRIELTKGVVDANLNLFSQMFSNLADIFGANSKAGQAAAIAQATIDTFAGASKALASVPFPFNIAAAAATVASGVANVVRISKIDTGNEFNAVKSAAQSTKKTKAEKGGLFKIGGKRHSAGGTEFVGSDGTNFEAEKGEVLGVMSRDASRAFMMFNDMFTGVGSINAPSSFESGGFPSRGSGTLSVDELAEKIAGALAEAVQDLPNPVVFVEDVKQALNAVVEIEQGASF